jgi:hypothetical protein
MKEGCPIPRGTSTSRETLSHVVGPILILLDQSSCIGLPKQSNRPPVFDPATNGVDHDADASIRCLLPDLSATRLTLQRST